LRLQPHGWLTIGMAIKRSIKIGNYDVTDIFSKGMGWRVYEATDFLLGRPATIKMIDDHVHHPGALQLQLLSRSVLNC
jgi:hypothetical protein